MLFSLPRLCLTNCQSSSAQSITGCHTTAVMALSNPFVLQIAWWKFLVFDYGRGCVFEYMAL
jgi:hypothetical protein